MIPIPKAIYEKRPGLLITTPLTIAIGIALLLPGIMILRSGNLSGLPVIILALGFLTYRIEFRIDPQRQGFTYSKKLYFIRLNSTKTNLKGKQGKMELIDDTQKVFGNQRSSIFVRYDVVYRKANHHKIKIFTSTSHDNSIRVAEFFSKHLNIPLEQKGKPI